MRKAANLAEALEGEFPDVHRVFEHWSNHIYECVIDFGWNVRVDGRESAGRVQTSDHSDSVFEEVSRLRMRENKDQAQAIDAHNIFRGLPRVWRRGVWAIYIEQAKSGETLAKVMGLDRREVGAQLKQAFLEIRGQLLPIAVRRVA